MRRQPPHNPASPHLHVRIGTAHRLLQNRAIQNLCRRLLRIHPVQRRGQQRLRFPRHTRAPPLRDRYQPHPSQASQPGPSPCQPIRDPALRQQMLNRLARAFWNFSLGRRQTIHLPPEHSRIAQLALRDRPQLLMILAQHKCPPARLHAALVSRQNRRH